MKYHVHIYKLSNKAEVDIEAETEEQAMKEALGMVKAGELVTDKEPEKEHMALAWEVNYE